MGRKRKTKSKPIAAITPIPIPTFADIRRFRQCEKKAAYETEQQAAETGMVVYQCEFCKKWHRTGVILRAAKSIAMLLAKRERWARKVRDKQRGQRGRYGTRSRLAAMGIIPKKKRVERNEWRPKWRRLDRAEPVLLVAQTDEKPETVDLDEAMKCPICGSTNH